MPLVFYNQQAELKKYFGNYLGDNNWNTAAVITDAPTGGPNDKILTEAGIRDTITSQASRFATVTGVADGQNFFNLIRAIAAGTNNDFTVYVLKGVHTKPELHLTVAFAGKLFHLNVKRTGSDDTRFSIHSMSEGTLLYDDPEWKKS
jgi:hypothetical protein